MVGLGTACCLAICCCCCRLANLTEWPPPPAIEGSELEFCSGVGSGRVVAGLTFGLLLNSTGFSYPGDVVHGGGVADEGWLRRWGVGDSNPIGRNSRRSEAGEGGALRGVQTGCGGGCCC